MIEITPFIIIPLRLGNTRKKLLLYKPAVQWNGLCLHEELGEKMRLGRIENLRKDGKEDEKCEGFWIERKINVLTMRAGEVACERSLKIEGLGT